MPKQARFVVTALAGFVVLLFVVFTINQTYQVVMLASTISPALGQIVLVALLALYVVLAGLLGGIVVKAASVVTSAVAGAAMKPFTQATDGVRGAAGRAARKVRSVGGKGRDSTLP